jgi:hypothetical protein
MRLRRRASSTTKPTKPTNTEGCRWVRASGSFVSPPSESTATPCLGGGTAWHSRGDLEGRPLCRPSRTTVGKQGSVEQARCASGDLRSSPGRRTPDGRTRQRPRTALPRLRPDSRSGDSPFVGLVGFVVIRLSYCTPKAVSHGARPGRRDTRQQSASMCEIRGKDSLGGKRVACIWR